MNPSSQMIPVMSGTSAIRVSFQFRKKSHASTTLNRIASGARIFVSLAVNAEIDADNALPDTMNVPGNCLATAARDHEMLRFVGEKGHDPVFPVLLHDKAFLKPCDQAAAGSSSRSIGHRVRQRKGKKPCPKNHTRQTFA